MKPPSKLDDAQPLNLNIAGSKDASVCVMRHSATLILRRLVCVGSFERRRNTAKHNGLQNGSQNLPFHGHGWRSLQTWALDDVRILSRRSKLGSVRLHTKAEGESHLAVLHQDPMGLRREKKGKALPCQIKSAYEKRRPFHPAPGGTCP
jgi:hypothetical protein